MRYFDKVFNRCALVAYLAPLVLILHGCGNVPLQRSNVEKLEKIAVVRVVTPAMYAPSFMQAAVRSGTVLGAIPGLIVSNEQKFTFMPPLIQDFGILLTDGLQRRLVQQAPWWPKMTTLENPVPANYVYPDSYWLRVEVLQSELAPPPMRTVFITARVSLHRPYGQNGPLWSKLKTFSGFVHGGEKIDMDKLPNDPAQLRQEIQRAADWLVEEMVADIS